MELKDRGVAVFCGSSPGTRPAYAELADEVGRAIAACGATLVYGGGSVGLMGCLADGALAREGAVVGVIPRALATAEVMHAGLSETIVVQSMHERKAIMAARADAFLVLPGGFGTYDEFIEIVTWRQLHIHDKPIALINFAGFFDPLLQQVDHAISEGFIRPVYRDLFHTTNDVPTALEWLGSQPEPAGMSEMWG